MAGYFEEMGWEPLGDGETPNNLLHLVRFLLEFQYMEPEAQLAPAASKASIDALPNITVSKEEGECTICLKPWETGDSARQMPCKHTFHPQCILPWLEKTNSCPLCRHELPTDDPEYEESRKRKLRAIQRVKDIEALHDSMFS
ncbi:E3 ubiquitin-protein ligase RNF181-like [Macrosteles quadrilineatus]|uniref:E3 ubiquitin-protein ligase RNF181-like n=1 Tax=Macrosteles quadrilineatus TaxID=74068 RepID=UPI0023E27DAD|nr:E3 ubiquitin-protein ligase RNF181-like [Macrosteles quadrilineatus]